MIVHECLYYPGGYTNFSPNLYDYVRESIYRSYCPLPWCGQERLVSISSFAPSTTPNFVYALILSGDTSIPTLWVVPKLIIHREKFLWKENKFVCSRYMYCNTPLERLYGSLIVVFISCSTHDNYYYPNQTCFELNPATGALWFVLSEPGSLYGTSHVCSTN